MEELVEKKEDIEYLKDLSSDEENFILDDRLKINLYDRIDFIIDLKKNINEDNEDNYQVAFKIGYYLAFIIDRENFLKFKEEALENINLPYNEYSEKIKSKTKRR